LHSCLRVDLAGSLTFKRERQLSTHCGQLIDR
jgi:hypothetical protein